MVTEERLCEHAGSRRAATANAPTAFLTREMFTQITISRLAIPWVAAGTVHDPVAHRCQPRTAPAAASMGRAHMP